MSSSSAARVLDLLSAPEAPVLEPGVSVATVPRSERIAPDVTAIGGAEAVAIVRGGGFIVAIESVASELAEGMVIEQEPLAGERLEREAVITLRLPRPNDEGRGYEPDGVAKKTGMMRLVLAWYSA
jgi:hypothetical protein